MQDHPFPRPPPPRWRPPPCRFDSSRRKYHRNLLLLPPDRSERRWSRRWAPTPRCSRGRPHNTPARRCGPDTEKGKRSPNTSVLRFASLRHLPVIRVQRAKLFQIRGRDFFHRSLLCRDPGRSARPRICSTSSCALTGEVHTCSSYSVSVQMHAVRFPLRMLVMMLLHLHALGRLFLQRNPPSPEGCRKQAPGPLPSRISSTHTSDSPPAYRNRSLSVIRMISAGEGS